MLLQETETRESAVFGENCGDYVEISIPLPGIKPNSVKLFHTGLILTLILDYSSRDNLAQYIADTSFRYSGNPELAGWVYEDGIIRIFIVDLME